MRILNLHINGFGKLQNRDFSFDPGLNVVYGQNEAGKSTLHTFIRGMLFGIEKQRGRASKNDLYSKYEPWEGSGTYEGYMRVESQGEIFRIERRFVKKDQQLRIINETLGREEEPSAALLDRLRCGLSETAYNNTVSIGQLKCATDSGMVAELRNYIANLNTSGSLSLNITRASAYLKSQRRDLESQLLPQAALSYTSILGEIRKLEQEISAPEYENQLSACRDKKAALKQRLEEKQKERENLIQKAARGRQLLAGSQFDGRSSILSCQENVRQLYQNYESSQSLCKKAPGRGRILLLILAALLCMGCAGYFAAQPQRLQGFFLTLPVVLGVLGAGGFIFLALAVLLALTGNRYKRSMTAEYVQLRELFQKYLGDTAVTPEAMTAFEKRTQELLRLCDAIDQSEQTLAALSQEMASLQKEEEACSEEIEKQQKIQWELEKKLEHLASCKTQAEALKRSLSENARIQEEIDAIDLAQETMTSLSTSIRDSFGLYLNKTASELISSITGGAYGSMSIDQNLNVFMNTPSRLVPLDQVSTGTMDQIHLAVRLAAAKLMQTGPDFMPLIFDDSFTLYDDERLKTALKWLASAYENQIIIFTCHQREAQLLTANQVPVRMVRI